VCREYIYSIITMGLGLILIVGEEGNREWVLCVMGISGVLFKTES
jgi:hypothetical protein